MWILLETTSLSPGWTLTEWRGDRGALFSKGPHATWVTASSQQPNLHMEQDMLQRRQRDILEWGYREIAEAGMMAQLANLALAGTSIPYGHQFMFRLAIPLPVQFLACALGK